MPYYQRRFYRPRRRWFWPRRFRRPFRRRRFRYRRRHRWVRRKLSKIPIRQWQPKTIKNCTVKGLHCLFLANHNRLSNNYRQTEHSLVPEHGPGGGGFSVTKYSLDALYEQHQLARNWWTKSNKNLPLVRYRGCTLKLYRSHSVDYVVNIHNCWPMLATNELYMSCQPSMLMMNYKAIFVPSKLTKPGRKMYKRVRIPPPGQLENKWYFTKDLSTIGLVMITASAASFDNYYIATNNESNNISFVSLNPHFWRRHDFQQPGIDGYATQIEGTTQKHIWATNIADHQHNVTKLTYQNLVYLADTTNYKPGTFMTTTTNNKVRPFISDHKNWGNPFYTNYLNGDDDILVSTKPLGSFITDTTDITEKLKTENFQFISQNMMYTCRYSPDRDTGHNTRVYLKSNVRETTGWEPPHKSELIAEGFPLWLVTFGFLDWQRKLGEAINIDRDYLLVIESPFIDPQLPYYIPLDYDFIHGQSPYPPHDQTQHIRPPDQTKWFPCTYFQHQTIEQIVQTGPGIAKLGGRKTVEAKIEYSFKFKFGGCPPKMEKVDNPTEQPTYPVPNNNSEMSSLQNPNWDPQQFLYTFDVRKDILTKTAAKRIKKDWKSEKCLFADAGKLQPEAATALQTPETSSEETDSENEEETLLQKLRLQRRKRKRLQYKLLQLMKQE